MAKPIIQRLTEQLQAQGMPLAKARATAISQQQKAGNLKAGSTELTSQGKQRQERGAAGRAIDRAAKYSGRSSSDYVYANKTNRATLKKG